MKEAHKMNYDLDVTKTIELKSAISDGGNEKKAAEMKGIWVKLNPEMFAFVEDANTTIVKITDGKVGCGCDDFNKATTDRLCKHLIAFKNLKKPPAVSIQSPDYRLLRAYMFETGWSAGEDRWVYPSTDAPTESEDAPELNEETSNGTEMVHYECPKCGDIVDIESSKLRDWKLNHMDVCTGTKANESPKTVTQEPPETSDPEIPDNSKQTQEAVVKESLTTDAKTAQVAEPPSKTAEKVNPPSKKYTCELCGEQYESADDALNCIERCKESEAMRDTKALVPSDTESKGNWTDEQIEVMRKTVAANATPAEFAYFLNVAKYSGLNPFLREIYFVKNDKGQTTIITGRDGYLTIAKRDPRFCGIHSMEVCENDQFKMSFVNGIMEVSEHTIIDFTERGKIVGAWARGKMQGQYAVTIFASMKEYDKGGDAMGGKVWKKYPSSMIRKVAEAMVLKRIAGISGLVTEAEIGSTGLIVIEGGE